MTDLSCHYAASAGTDWLGRKARSAAARIAEGPFRIAMRLAGRHILARAISVGGLLTAAAIYGPETFGPLGVYLGVLFLAQMGVFLRYDGAIIGGETPRIAASATRLCVVIGTLVLLAGAFIAAALSAFGVMSSWLVPAIIAALACRALLRLAVADANRHGDLTALADSTLVQSVAQPLVIIMLASSSLQGLAVMVAADVVGHLVAAAAALRRRRVSLGSALAVPVSIAEIVATARSWRSLPTRNLPCQMLNLGFVNLPLFVMPFMADPAFAGAVALAYRLLDSPAQLASASVTPILLGYLSKARTGRPAIGLRFGIVLFALAIAVLYASVGLATILVWPALMETQWHYLGLALAALGLFHAAIAFSSPLVDATSVFRHQDSMAPIHGIAIGLAVGVFLALHTSPVTAFILIGCIALVRAMLIARDLLRLSLAGPSQPFIRAST